MPTEGQFTRPQPEDQREIARTAGSDCQDRCACPVEQGSGISCHSLLGSRVKIQEGLCFKDELGLRKRIFT